MADVAKIPALAVKMPLIRGSQISPMKANMQLSIAPIDKPNNVNAK